ncbi:HD family phosphohydrolase [Leptolyngbya sp. AN02str]|uniref:HD family phosphohydrolase n=1 Tax=Leptolyngbya sp. AN02str TaxID=3423363 RepID=UPI003D30FBD2
MKSFRQLIQQVHSWHRAHVPGQSSQRSATASSHGANSTALSKVSKVRKHCHNLACLAGTYFPAQRLLEPISHRKTPHPPRWSSKAVFVLAVFTLTSTIGYRLYNEPQLAVGRAAPRTLRAPTSATVLDVESTEKQRSDARLGAVQVLKLDESVNQTIYQSIQRYLDEGDRVRLQAGTFPFFSTAVLSTTSQRYVRQAPEDEWEMVVKAVEGERSLVGEAENDRNRASSTSRLTGAQSSFELAILELQNYRRSVSADDYSVLKQIIVRARQNYARASAMLSDTADDSVQSFYTPELLSLSDTEWMEVRVKVRRILERMLAQGIPPGLPESLLSNAVRTHTVTELSSDRTTPLVNEILMASLEPNLVHDPEQTRQQAEQAARAVKEVMVEIRRGEIIVEAGQPITQREFVLLDHFGMSQRQINWAGLVGFAILVSGGMAIVLLVERRFHPGLRRRDYVLVTLLTITTPLLVSLGVPATSLPVVGLLVGSFYGSALGVTVVSLLSVVLPIGMEIGLQHLAASAVASVLGAYMAGQLRSREELALLGGAVGLTQAAVYLLLSLIITPWSPSVLYAILSASAVQGFMGLVWSVIALGISPYLEQLFDLVTPVRLAELANPNRPLLKRLAAETPGTFQHTLFVSTLAEAAARALGCNVELVRAGTLYHDIGKMHDPLGFIENQMGGPNKHDVIDDPWRSASIIKQHVTTGLVMARRYRLPKAIQAFIPEHQGTMFITYFYHQALERAKANPALQVSEVDFRYDGPTPQSRETGLVMLADSCEAALRSLKDATPKEALIMVNRILRARWQDNQLVDSGLTRDEMPRIAEVFVKVWQDYNHQRIAYPKAVMLPPTPSFTN